MKRIVFALLVVAAAAVVAPGSASAQTDAVLFKAPFNFIVGGTLLPAGSYRIAPDAHDSSLLLISNANGKSAAFVATGRTENQGIRDPQVKVAFKNVDGQYFLSRIAMPGGDSREIVVTKAQAERTLARLNLLPAERGDVAK